MAERFVLNEMSYFGWGSREVLTSEVAKRGYKKAFMVTDKPLVSLGIADKVTSLLGVDFEVFSDVKANPTIKNVQNGVDAFKKSGADFIVALGGGSAMDTAKGVGIIANNPEHYGVTTLEGAVDTKNKSVPVIALPTTAGTAAEVTINYVITDEVNVKKMVCVDPNDIPVLAIIDAELMSSMPAPLAAATGMDALTHAIEGYITKGANVMSDMFAIKAIELISQNLKEAVENPQSKTAKEGMALGQYIAGMGFSNVGLGIVHSMAHPLGALYDTPHGVANALLLPYVMEYNASAASKKYRAIAKAMGVCTKEMDEAQAAIAAIDAVKALSQSIKIPTKLVEVGVLEKDLPKLSQAAFNDVCTGGNPRDTNPDEILEIYKKAFK